MGDRDQRLLDADYVLAALRVGATFYVGTHARVTAIKHKHVEAWAKAGKSLLKSQDGHLYMRQGKGYVDVSYASLSLEGGTRNNPGRHRHQRARRNGALGLTAADYERREVPGFSGYNPRSAMGRRRLGGGNGRSAVLLGTLDALVLHGRTPCSKQALKGWYVGFIPEGKRLICMRRTRREVPLDALSLSVRQRHRQFHGQAPSKAILYDLPNTKGSKEQVGLIESLTYVVPSSVKSPSKSGYRWVHAFGDHGESGHGEATERTTTYPTHLMPALDVDRAGNISVRRRPGNKYDVTTWIYW